jgi:hypothetical protein
MKARVSVDPGVGAGRGFGLQMRDFLVFFFCILGVASVHAAGFQDYFTNRELLTATSGQITTNNNFATIEPAEPEHAGKPGGHSLWISWLAPSNGVVTFNTEGSGFDTLMAAYYFNSTNDTTFDKLVLAAGADDSEDEQFESQLQFGVLAGQRYEIAVDGYYGATGHIEFQWSFQALPFAPPIILGTDPDRAVRIGDPVTLTAYLTEVTNAHIQWMLNGRELDIKTTNLFIPSMAVANVGRYKVQIAVSNAEYFTPPIELQINSDGSSNTLARSKLRDAEGTPLIGTGLLHIPPAGAREPIPTGVVRGYNGSQIFNTTYAVPDPTEPAHCGFSGGSSYWLIYQPPTNGAITLDTSGSTYNTVMEAYTFNGTPTGYQDLISIACDHNSLGTTNGASRIQFSVLQARQYVVVVEGVNGGHGTAWINYNLDTNQLPDPPTLLAQPSLVAVAQGFPATIQASVGGTPPFQYTWQKDTNAMPGLKASSLFFPSASTNDTANYILSVTNDVGFLSATYPLKVLLSTTCSLTSATDWMSLNFGTVQGQTYFIEQASAVTGPWQAWPNFFPGDGQPVTVYLSGDSNLFFRVRIQ